MMSHKLCQSAIAWSVLPYILAACGEAETSERGLPPVPSDPPREVIEITRADLQNAPSVELVELLRLGSRDGPPESRFFRIADAKLRDNQLYILDAGEKDVRVFDTLGAFSRRFGREGDGPGEFRVPYALFLKGDTVVVADHRRLNLLDQDGNELGAGPGTAGGSDWILMRATVADGHWFGEWVRQEAQQEGPDRWYRESTAIHRLHPRTGERLDAIFGYVEPKIPTGGELGFFIPPFFMAEPRHTVGADGRVYFTPADEYRIDVWDRQGSLARRITGDYEPRRVTEKMLSEAIAAERNRVEDAPAGSETAMYRSALDERIALPTPEFRPVLGNILASPSGWVLVLRLDLDEEPVNGDDSSTWDLLDPAGLLSGRVSLPPRAHPIELLDDGILAVIRDELDVQYLVRYRFNLSG